MARTMLPVSGLRVQGETVRPFYRPKGNGLRDIREVSGQFFLSVQEVWEERGNEILHRVADKHPELFFAGMIKLCQVTKVEVGSSGDFAKLGNREEIAQKLEQKAGPEARKLFEKFVRDVRKLQAQQDQETR
jgi:long-subunit acyl-CoA synthetase (AMP-forming)